MNFNWVVWDHTEWDGSIRPVLRSYLKDMGIDAGSRGCKLCGGRGIKPGPVQAPPTCSCWNAENSRQRFILWYHARTDIFGPAHFSDWLGHELLLAVIRLTVGGNLTPPHVPSMQGHTPFLAVYLSRPLRKIEELQFKNGVYVLGQALTCAAQAAKKGGDILESFRMNQAFEGNWRGAALWNAAAPDPLNMFLWGLHDKRGNRAEADKLLSTWNGVSPRRLAVPPDLLAEFDARVHASQVDDKEVEKLVENWFKDKSAYKGK